MRKDIINRGPPVRAPAPAQELQGLMVGLARVEATKRSLVKGEGEAAVG